MSASYQGMLLLGVITSYVTTFLTSLPIMHIRSKELLRLGVAYLRTECWHFNLATRY